MSETASALVSPEPRAWAPSPNPSRGVRSRLRHPIRWAVSWVRASLRGGYGSLRLALFMASPRLRAGRLDASHPWATGLSPHTGVPVWPANVLYASPRKLAWNGPEPDPDDAIVTRIGRFLVALVRRSAARNPGVPRGPGRRMPNAVSYIHGTVHFNGGFLVFNDFEDARLHFSDQAFVREVRRFAREERRELTLVMRERRHDPGELAGMVGFLGARFPWWANPNGSSEERVKWPSPYPAINLINGSWIEDVDRLREGRMDELVRPPIEPGRWFLGEYRDSPTYLDWERPHAWADGMMASPTG